MEKDYPDASRLKLAYEKDFGKVYIMEKERIMICVLTKDYVTIKKFQQIFNAMAEFVKTYSIEKFIFDKRYLRAFHQPSMEWYFVDWKMEMYQYGLKTHRKILPVGEGWFKEAVMAGRDRIFKRYSHLDFGKLDIQYRDSVIEAVES